MVTGTKIKISIRAQSPMSVTVVVTDEERWVGLRFKAMSLAEGSRLEILGVVYESARGSSRSWSQLPHVEGGFFLSC
jgi:hypothetical protein